MKPHPAIKVGARNLFLGKGAKQVFMGKCALPQAGLTPPLVVAPLPEAGRPGANFGLGGLSLGRECSEEGYYWEVSA